MCGKRNVEERYDRGSMRYMKEFGGEATVGARLGSEGTSREKGGGQGKRKKRSDEAVGDEPEVIDGQMVWEVRHMDGERQEWMG